MRFIKLILLTVFFCYAGRVNGQTVNCPPNIDFELGNFNNWVLYAGTCCPISTSLSGAIVNRHTITSGTAVDPYGGFPIVNPATGLYSLKLGNNINGKQAERARYYVKVPAGINNYSLIFRYAVVFQDPGHIAAEQPRFEVKGYDSLTNAPIPCAQFTYVASALPGFSYTIVGADTVRYKSWTTASINLSGYAGKTVAVDFASGDCALGGHFGYGYIDINCALFQISSSACSNAPTTTLTAPPGFSTYEWWDSSFTTQVGIGQVVTIVTPPATKKYALILKPYTGFGCPDTLYTNLKIFQLNTALGSDTLICKNDTARINSVVAGSSPPYTYAWSPPTNLSCLGCANPKATPPSTQAYVLTVTDADGCVKKDTIGVNVNQGPQVTLTGTDVRCFGLNNGNITSTVTGGLTPYTYTWNTVPVKTTAGINTLAPGIYNVEVKDVLGCKMAAADTITQPTKLKDTITHTDVLCFGGNNASATVIASGGTPPYSYVWSTLQTSATINTLTAGSYIVTVMDNMNCALADTEVVVQPAAPLLAAVSSHTNVSCFGGSNGASQITTSGGTSPYSYSWNTSPVKTTAAATGLSAGIYTLTITDANGCVKIISDTITQPPLLTAATTKTDVSCYSGNNGSAASIVVGGTTPYTYSWSTSPVQSVAAISGLIVGTYALTVTDARSCTATATAVISQPSAVATAKTKADVVCNGGSTGSATVIATGGIAPYVYTWNTTPSKTGSFASGLPMGSYIVTTTDAQNCIKKDTLIIAQPSILSVAATNTMVSCYNGNNATALATAGGGVIPYTYSWNTFPPQLTANATNLPAGTYMVTVADNNGCVNADTVIVTQPAALNVTIAKTDVPCNAGTNGTALATMAGGTAPYTYSWNTLPLQTTAAATSLTAGTYIVTVTDAENCQSLATTTITQPTALAITGNKVDVTCFGLANGSAGVNVSGGTLPYTYSWNTTPLKNTASVSSLTSGTYIATVTDAHNCNASNTLIIAQPASLIATMSETDVNCFGGTNGTATVSLTGGNTPYVYTWNTTPAQTAATATNLTKGKYIVSITDNKGCSQTDTAEVEEPLLLTAIANVANVTCYNGTNGNANVVASGGTLPYTYWWNTVPVQTTANAQNLLAGKYTVQVTDARGCVVSVTPDSVLQPAEILMAAEPLTKTCVATANGTARIINVVGGIPPYSYVWNTIPVQKTDTAHNLASGVYSVSITDANGCSKSANVIIDNFLPPVVNAGVDTIICPGGIAHLLASGANTYSWSPSSGLSCVNCAATVANPKVTTSYTVLGVDKNNCIDTDEVVVVIAEKKGGEVGPDLKICKGDNIRLHAAGGVAYTWTPATSLNDPFVANPMVVADTNTKYRVIVKENECFNDTLYQQVTIYARPTVDLGPDLSGIPGATLQLHAEVTNTTGISWAPASLLSCYDCYDPVASLKQTITYIAVVTNDSICFSQDEITIRVACDGSFLFIPNTFTPNGDGLNDRFYISGQGLNTISLMRIYSRWGEMMFEARNIPPNDEWKGWDGTYKGNELSPDVYVYYLEVNCSGDEKIFLKGDISIIR